mmetsp:Transcript_94821/g.178417  ORF Transcript_94821/g.178417 Transcript_94821/m.178417 type:complete len:206 (-) Transcript_94821:240-857(-)
MPAASLEKCAERHVKRVNVPMHLPGLSFIAALPSSKTFASPSCIAEQEPPARIMLLSLSREKQAVYKRHGGSAMPPGRQGMACCRRPVPKSQSSSWSSGRQLPVSRVEPSDEMSRAPPQTCGPTIARTAVLPARRSQNWTVLSQPALTRSEESSGWKRTAKTRLECPDVVRLSPPFRQTDSFFVSSSKAHNSCMPPATMRVPSGL